MHKTFQSHLDNLIAAVGRAEQYNRESESHWRSIELELLQDGRPIKRTIEDVKEDLRKASVVDRAMLPQEAEVQADHDLAILDCMDDDVWRATEDILCNELGRFELGDVSM